MPRLRHLDLYFQHADDSESKFLVISDAPLLRTVYVGAHLARVVLPWAQLTSLTLWEVCFRECGPVLEQTANLISCKLGLLNLEDSFNPTQPSPITLLHLKSFQLLLVDCSECERVIPLNTLTTPSLRCLDISEELLGRDDPVQTLTSFMSRSDCDLQELVIREMEDDEFGSSSITKLGKKR
ncbi:hypothetical protein C8R46DRAFT_1144155 [Mycena filopes]|nr:hypothetical protein C8R46DRAFT_1144155 [Mycena filopes]